MNEATEPAIVLSAPLVYPISRKFGIHNVHYSMVAVMAMGVGLFTPPFGIGFYAACAVGQVSPDAVIPAYLAVRCRLDAGADPGRGLSLARLDTAPTGP